MDQLADLLRARVLQQAAGADSSGARVLVELLDGAASPVGVDVDIRGPGASGSTHLANFLHREAGLRCNLLVDPDGARHAPWPPPPGSLPSPPPLLVYLYGDPLLAAASFFRRGIAAEQALKTSGGMMMVAGPRDEQQQQTRRQQSTRQQEASRRARRAMAAQASSGGGGGDDDPSSLPRTLDELLEEQQDPFVLDEHLSGWLELPAAAEVVFLRYESAFEPDVARRFFARALRASRARRRRGGGAGNDDEEEAERLAREWCAQRRDRRTRLTAEQREKGRRVFAAWEARAALLPFGGCFVRAGDPLSSPPAPL